ncbi:nuclear transport factor 2 family protein [Agromyces sp. LHK192]|uniref:nuclear transport factor 2 family protein n=1 Tax=Agromyces sp. LHK192 TaxID=2498704 RepID=UPI0013E3572C|nr:nuclear transport factor 2 family protein [Agromyces sp. LHK192]
MPQDLDGSDRTTAAPAAVLAAATALNDALSANDADRLDALLAGEWRLVGADGPIDRDRFVDLVRTGVLSHSMMQPVGDLEVRTYGDVAVVTGRVVNTAFFDGQRFDADEWTTDVWVRRERGWTCVHSHVTEAASGTR